MFKRNTETEYEKVKNRKSTNFRKTKLNFDTNIYGILLLSTLLSGITKINYILTAFLFLEF